MASSKEYLQFVLEQLSELEEITYRAMMGEFIIYYRGKIAGGIYDDRLLVKPTKSAVAYMPTASYELPYKGAKEMLLVNEVDNKEFLTGLFLAMYDELPAPKPLAERDKLHQSGISKKRDNCKMNGANELFKNLNKLHTTELGVERIKRNLSLDTDDVVDWCKAKINSANAVVTRSGKNWYVNADNCILTVNAYSYTIITAHKEKK